MPTTAAVVPAAGRGERLGVGPPKALRLLAGKSLLDHAVTSLLAVVDLVVVAVPSDELPTLHDAFCAERVIVVAGGTTRQASVALALACLPAEVSVVLVHDAARPLTPVSLIQRVVDAVLGGSQAVVPGLAVADTIKSVDAADRVDSTLDRSSLRAIQTPQGFDRALLDRAYAAAADVATDDAGLVERIGAVVTVIPGADDAFKVTRPFDFEVAHALLGARSGASS